MSNELVQLETQIGLAGSTAEEVFEYVRDRLIEDTRELAKNAELALERAREHTVSNSEDALIAINHGQQIKKDQEILESRLGDVKKKAHKVHKAVIAAIDVVKDPLDRAGKVYAKKIAAWQERERIRQEEELRQRQEEARVKREKEYAKAKKHIEKLTSEIGDVAERIVALEDLRDKPDVTADQMDAINAEINTLQMILDGKHEALEEKHETIVASSLPEPSEAPAPLPKLAGVTESYDLEIVVYNKRQLLHAVQEHVLPLEAVVEEMAVLKRLAKSGMNLPGCNVKKIPKVTIRK